MSNNAKTNRSRLTARLRRIWEWNLFAGPRI